jgi:hypothetical protein
MIVVMSFKTHCSKNVLTYQQRVLEDAWPNFEFGTRDETKMSFSQWRNLAKFYFRENLPNSRVIK